MAKDLKDLEELLKPQEGEGSEEKSQESEALQAEQETEETVVEAQAPAEELSPEAKELAKFLTQNPEVLSFVRQATSAYQQNLQYATQYQPQQTLPPTFIPVAPQPQPQPTVPTTPQVPPTMQLIQQPQINLEELESKFWSKPAQTTLELIQQVVLPHLQQIYQLVPLITQTIEQNIATQVENFVASRLSNISDEKLQEEIATQFVKLAEQVPPQLLTRREHLENLWSIAVGKVAENRLTSKKRPEVPPPMASSESGESSAPTTPTSPINELGSRIESLLRDYFNRRR